MIQFKTRFKSEIKVTSLSWGKIKKSFQKIERKTTSPDTAFLHLYDELHFNAATY